MSRSTLAPRIISTRYAICWNVKNEIPSGRTTSENVKGIPLTMLTVSRMNPIYLK